MKKFGPGLLVIILLTAVLLGGCGGGSYKSTYNYYAYVIANSDIDHFRMYPINSDGTLNESGYVDTTLEAGSSPGAYCDAVTPNGLYLYVAYYSSGYKVAAYQIAKNGSLTGPVDTEAAADTPMSMAIDSQGKFLYIACSQNKVLAFQISSTEGTLTATTGDNATDYRPEFLALSPGRNLLYLAQDTLDHSTTLKITSYTFNSSTGALTKQGGVNTSSYPCSLAVSSSDRVYASCFNGSVIAGYNITNFTTGALTPMSPATYSTGGGPCSITIDRTGHYALVALQSANRIESYQINVADGHPVLPSASFQATGTAPDFVALHPSNQFAYVTCFAVSPNLYAYSFNSSTGALASIGSYAFEDTTKYIAIAKVKQ